MNEITLKGMVISVCGSVKQFAIEMGWSYRKASYIVNKRQEATAKDIEKMADFLNVEVPDLFRRLFFT